MGIVLRCTFEFSNNIYVYLVLVLNFGVLFAIFRGWGEGWGWGEGLGLHSPQLIKGALTWNGQGLGGGTQVY